MGMNIETYFVFLFSLLILLFLLGFTFPETKNNPIRILGYLWYRGQFDAIHKDIEKQIEKKYKKEIDKSVENITKSTKGK